MDDYVEAFVRSVNRGRALTVESVMRPPHCRVTADEVSDALAQMRTNNAEFGYCVSDGEFEGVVSQKDLEQAAQSNGHSQLADHTIDDVATVLPGARLEEALADTVAADYPLPVVGQDGKLVGELSQEAVLEVLGDSAEDESSDKNGS